MNARGALLPLLLIGLSFPAAAAEPKFVPPPVLQDGIPLSAGNVGVQIACRGGSLEVVDANGRCPRVAPTIDREFHETALPVMNRCIRASLPAGTVTDEQPIEARYLDLCNPRNVAGTKRRSLHDACRAYDLGLVKAGKLLLNHGAAWKRQVLAEAKSPPTDDPEWNDFWHPVMECLYDSPGGFWQITVYDKPVDHWNHIHFSMPLPAELNPEGRWANGD